MDGIVQKQKGLIMSMCNGCQHCGDKAGECKYNGVCVVKKYNLQLDNASAFRPSQSDSVAPIMVATDEPVFNPFQRGNGCTLSGYTYREIFGSHTR